MTQNVAENDEVVVISRVVAATPHLEAVRGAYNRPLSPEMRRAGCTQYNCYQDLGDQNRLLAVGVWRNEACFNQHLRDVREELKEAAKLLLAPPETQVLQSKQV